MRVENAQEAVLEPSYHKALKDLLYALADDELILGHRCSEWLGLAPDIEEDIAFSSIAQDEIGHATFFYNLLSELGEGQPDELAFARPASKFRNARFLEQQNGDFAHAIARGFLYDVYDNIRLKVLLQSSYVPLAEGVVKILREEHYHLLHLQTWFTRLAIAGGEAKDRLERAISMIWADIPDLFSFCEDESPLVSLGIVPMYSDELHHRWEEKMLDVFRESGLIWPQVEMERLEKGARMHENTNELEQLLSVMSEVYRIDPAANW